MTVSLRQQTVLHTVHRQGQRLKPYLCWLHWLWRIPLLLLVLSVVIILFWRVVPPESSAFMLRQNITAHFDESVPAVRQEWVDYEDISPQMVLAVIAAEDQRFPEHYGIDTASTRKAIQAALQGRVAGGGSTITQQVAKNLFLWSERSYVRKGLEWVLALLLELLWDKQRIIEVYLNIAQFSARDYGVGAASTHLLGKTPTQLRRQEAALLAAALPSPQTYRVNKPSRTVRNRQRHILKQMRQLGGVAYLGFLSD
ncbi:MAG: monofunctional biosynthetic peptidoglycan transglycosylase [Thiothrix nivea]|nr:MAG: monofunctional biosynthetic peptidoglycan transglycosylase [Thiothrix nivea]